MAETLGLSWILIIFPVFGACFGSFANMLIHRLPRDEEMVKTASHCPACNAPLGWRQLIPIFSYLLQNGKCHSCRKKISSRYLWVELVCTSFFALIGYLYSLTPLAAILCLVTLCLITLTVIDLEHMMIPDEIQIALVALGGIYIWASSKPWKESLILSVSGFLLGLFLRWLMFVWKKREGLGWGDVKFLGVAGLYLTPALLAPFYFIAGVMGIFTAYASAQNEEGHFPFGPSLALALLWCVVFPVLITNYFAQIIHFIVEFSIVNADK